MKRFANNNYKITDSLNNIDNDSETDNVNNENETMENAENYNRSNNNENEEQIYEDDEVDAVENDDNNDDIPEEDVEEEEEDDDTEEREESYEESNENLNNCNKIPKRLYDDYSEYEKYIKKRKLDYHNECIALNSNNCSDYGDSSFNFNDSNKPTTSYYTKTEDMPTIQSNPHEKVYKIPNSDIYKSISGLDGHTMSELLCICIGYSERVFSKAKKNLYAKDIDLFSKIIGELETFANLFRVQNELILELIRVSPNDLPHQRIRNELLRVIQILLQCIITIPQHSNDYDYSNYTIVALLMFIYGWLIGVYHINAIRKIIEFFINEYKVMEENQKLRY